MISHAPFPLLIALLAMLAFTPSTAIAAGGQSARLGLPVKTLLLTPPGTWTLLERQLFSALYDTPVELDSNGDPTPHAAINVAHDYENLNWILTLHPGLRWSDGSPVSAEQVIAGWEFTIRRHPLNAPAFGVIQGYSEFVADATEHLTGVSAPDATHIQIALRREEARFATRLADPSFALCRGTVTRQGEADSWVESMGGTGPYRVDNLVGHSLTLLRNEFYLGGTPRLARWDWQLLGSADAVARSYLAGRLDVAPLAADQTPMFKENHQYSRQLVDRRTTTTIGLVWNPRGREKGNGTLRQRFLELVDARSIRTLTLVGEADAVRGHFSERLGLPSPPSSSLSPGEPFEVVFAVPTGARDLRAIADRLALAGPADSNAWRIRIVERSERQLLQPGSDWDVALWMLPGAVQPALAEGADFIALWDHWGANKSEATAWDEERRRIAQAEWLPIVHPRFLWLRQSRLSGLIAGPATTLAWDRAGWED
ncbi:MAG: ABC transporter substrate-binding protein [bacterium]